MKQSEREAIIEQVGVTTANHLQELEYKIDALQNYLKIVFICGTIGLKAVPDPFIPGRISHRDYGGPA